MTKNTKDWLVIGGVALGAYALLKFMTTGSLRGLGDASASDVSKDEDLCQSIQNLLALEDHLASSAGQSGEQKFVDALNRAREMRRNMMSKLLPADAAGQSWCIVKHCLSAGVHAREVGDKLTAEGKPDQAQEFYKQAEELKQSAIAMSATAQSGGQCPVCKGG